MLDHISLLVFDFERVVVFYDVVLATIGLSRRKQVPGGIGYGTEAMSAPCFSILDPRSEGAARPGLGLHVSFVAATRASVDAFHAAALRAGGLDAGPPGLRPEYTAPFYGAFVRDLDGFKIEAVCRGHD